MNLSELFYQARDTITLSPIRAIKAGGRSLPMDLAGEDLSSVERDMEVLIGKLRKPLKVVLMGEVKAGKSTLLNALAGGKVSPTNVTETTASIIEVYYSPVEEGVIIKTDGSEIKGTPEDIFKILDEHHGDQGFFETCESVKLGLPFSSLKRFYIVDTPGLATITEQNSKRTENYAQEADVVLWVLNGNHLGQADVEDAIAHMAKLGKPILGIVNRIDEVDTNPIRLVNYVRQRLGLYFTEIFPLSSYMAFEAVMSDDKEVMESSGFTQLFDYLIHNIESKPQEIHDKSLLSSLHSLLRRDLSVHEHYSRNIETIRDKIKEHKEKLEYQASKIKSQIERRLHLWVRQEFLTDEVNELNAQINKMSFLSGKKEAENIENMVKAYFDPDRIQGEVQKVIDEINEEYKKEWQISINTIIEEISAELQEFAQSEGVRYANEYMSSVPSTQQLIMDGAGKGAAIAGAYGTAIAFYAATMGPYAAVISIGSALASVLPPLLIAGAAVGAVVKVIGLKKQKDKCKEDIRQAVSEIKADIENTMIPNILYELQNKNDQIIADLQAGFEKELSKSWSDDELRDLDEEIKSYCAKLDSCINRAEQMSASAS